MTIFKRHQATNATCSDGFLTIEVPQLVLSREWDANNPDLPALTEESAKECEAVMVAYAEQLLKKGQVYQLLSTIPSDFGRTRKMSLVIGFFSTWEMANCLFGKWATDMASGVMRKFMKVQT